MICFAKRLTPWWIGFSIGLSILLAIGSTTTGKTKGIDLQLLRTILCDTLETAYCVPGNKLCPKPEWAFDRQDWSSIGACQIHLSTADYYGYGRTKDPKKLFDRETSELVADQLLVDLSLHLQSRGVYPTTFRLAFKYRCGRYRPIEKETRKGARCWQYALKAKEEYAKRLASP